MGEGGGQLRSYVRGILGAGKTVPQAPPQHFQGAIYFEGKEAYLCTYLRAGRMWEDEETHRNHYPEGIARHKHSTGGVIDPHWAELLCLEIKDNC